MGETSLLCAAEELPLLKPCESFLLPQQEDRGGEGEGQGQDVKGAGAIQLGSRAWKHGTEGVAVLLTWGKKGKWRFFLSCSVELPHQSSNTCRLAWPWNWEAEGGHRELLHPSPVLPTSATVPGTGALVRVKEDAAAATTGWSAGVMGPDPCFSSTEGLGLVQLTI